MYPMDFRNLPDGRTRAEKDGMHDGYEILVHADTYLTGTPRTVVVLSRIRQLREEVSQARSP